MSYKFTFSTSIKFYLFTLFNHQLLKIFIENVIIQLKYNYIFSYILQLNPLRVIYSYRKNSLLVNNYRIKEYIMYNDKRKSKFIK